MFRGAVAIAVVLTCVFGCGNRQGIGVPDASIPDAGSPPDAGDSGDAGPSALNVLFIGDSYTYVNDLPGMLSQIAATAGIPPTIATSQVVQGGATLQDQWNNGTAQMQIAQGRWTHVVLQDQSQEPLFYGDYANFYSYGEKFGNLIVDAGARPSLFVTWARAPGTPDYAPSSLDGYYFSPGEMQDELTSAYAKLGQQWGDGLLACVGEAFRRTYQQYPDIVLQQNDFSHPTVAGTYLAACTFYVALTGHPVSALSAVPAGLSTQEAALLREVARVGSNCAGVQPKAFVLWADGIQNGQSGLTYPEPDGGLQFAEPFDYGTAGSTITNYFVLTNFGETAAGLEDGLTLAPPFAWSGDAGYPGGSGLVTVNGFQSYSFCSSSLSPAAVGMSPPTCVVAVSYSGETSGTGVLTLKLTNDYQSGFSRELRGNSTARAALHVSADPGDFGCTDATCGPIDLTGGESANLVVSNRGGSSVTSLSVGTPLAPQFSWGGDGGAFPGGTGVGSVNGENYDYCTTQALGAGQRCMVTVRFVPTTDGGPFTTAVNLAASDASGTVTPNANRNIQGGRPPFQP